MGSHDVFLADIVSVSCDEKIIDSEGKMRFEKANLLAYAHGEYYTLGERVGRFGFSTDKPEKTQKTTPKQEKDDKKRPFYLDAPRGKRTPPKHTDKNKGKRRQSKK